MIEKVESVAFSVSEDDQVSVKRITRYMEDGVELSSSLHRHVLEPGQDFSQEDSKVQTVCQVLHTRDKVLEYWIKSGERTIAEHEKMALPSDHPKFYLLADAKVELQALKDELAAL
tara:strand:- start:164 stop:511 length:348 start_codon:yes stop_codon:yes gene_type:complete